MLQGSLANGVVQASIEVVEAEPDDAAGDIEPHEVAAGGGLDHDTAVRLVLEQEPLLVGFARAIVGSRDVAEDIFQDLVMLVMRKHASIPNQDAVSGWTRRATRFLALKRLQRMSRERPVMDEELVGLLERDFSELGFDTVGDQYLAALGRCRERLPAKSREILELRYEADLDCQQIADRLKRPLNTVYVMLTRLHRSLEECIRSRLRSSDA